MDLGISPQGAARAIEEDTEEDLTVLMEEDEDMVCEEELNKRLGKLLEKEKKRLTVGFVSEVKEIMRGYDKVIGNLKVEVASLRGSLKENRRCFKKLACSKKEEGMEGRSEEELAEQVIRIIRERERLDKENEIEARKENVVTESSVKDKKKRKKNKKNNTPCAGNEIASSRSYSEVVGKGIRTESEATTRNAGADMVERIVREKDKDFVEVRNRKAKQNKGEEKRKENWRLKEPTKTFVVEVGKKDKEAARKVLWSEITKKITAPRVAGVSVLARGDLRVTPGDADTLAALRSLEKEGKIGVREVGQNWPKVLVYDVDKDMKAEEVGRAVRVQNEDTGLEEGLEEADFRPLFRKGPKGGDTTWWVCEVNPKVYTNVVNRRLFIGLCQCRIIEYVDVFQCKGCLGFGHMEAKCVRKRIICSHCAKEGHRVKECREKEREPKCYNCGERREAGHRDCRVRRSVTRATMVRTDYGSK